MRITYLALSHPSIAGELAEALSTRGHQVLVITTSDKDYPYHIYKEHFTILNLYPSKPFIQIGPRSLSQPRRIILSSLSQFQPEIIHVYGSMQTGGLALAYARATSIPIILTIFQHPKLTKFHFLKPLHSLIDRFTWNDLRKYALVIAPTQIIASQITNLTGFKQNIVVDKLDSHNLLTRLSPEPSPASKQKQVLNLFCIEQSEICDADYEKLYRALINQIQP